MAPAACEADMRPRCSRKPAIKRLSNSTEVNDCKGRQKVLSAGRDWGRIICELLERSGGRDCGKIAVWGGILMAMSLGQGADAAEITGPTPFGKTKDGTAVEVYTLTNSNGVVAKVMTLGATVIELQVPDKAGKAANVVLGFDDV